MPVSAKLLLPTYQEVFHGKACGCASYLLRSSVPDLSRYSSSLHKRFDRFGQLSGSLLPLAGVVSCRNMALANMRTLKQTASGAAQPRPSRSVSLLRVKAEVSYAHVPFFPAYAPLQDCWTCKAAGLLLWLYISQLASGAIHAAHDIRVKHMQLSCLLVFSTCNSCGSLVASGLRSRCVLLQCCCGCRQALMVHHQQQQHPKQPPRYRNQQQLLLTSSSQTSTDLSYLSSCSRLS